MHPLVVTAAIVIRNGKILITQRPAEARHGGLWEFPGGKLDGGESPQECLARELKEEIDLSVEVGQIFEVVYHRYDWGPVLILAYLCVPTGGTLRHLEVADHRWVTVNELENFPFLPADLPIINKLKTNPQLID